MTELQYELLCPMYIVHIWMEHEKRGRNHSVQYVAKKVAAPISFRESWDSKAPSVGLKKPHKILTYSVHPENLYFHFLYPLSD